MPYITREDGERFIIPSYRDTLDAKKPALLKKEVVLLSQNYGEYITLQKKRADQYEAAFSPDTGYLLGETVWHYFKRPYDLIYCEAIPNTTEAILVIVKGGTVYLDGSFPVDSIPEELVIFRTQQNSFEIYTYGVVPISETPQEGKFTLDSSSIKSFTVLEEPLFPVLPRIKAFQLRLVDVVLKEQGIGVFPVKAIVILIIALGLLWMAYVFLTSNKKTLPPVLVTAVNPNQYYINTMDSPDVADQAKILERVISSIFTIPGWIPDTILYVPGDIEVKMKSLGLKTSVLMDWAAKNNAQFNLKTDGFYLSFVPEAFRRPSYPDVPPPLQNTIAKVIDRISTVTPGNQVTIGGISPHGRIQEAQITVAMNQLSLATFLLFSEQLRGLPIVLVKLTLTVNNGNLTGSYVLKVLGS